jgi:hypothetical protein
VIQSAVAYLDKCGLISRYETQHVRVEAIPFLLGSSAARTLTVLWASRVAA